MSEVAERVCVTLYSVTQARQEIGRVWAEVLKPKFAYAAIDGANVRYVLEVHEETRSDKQNKLLHSRVGDVAKQCQWAGRKWETDEWKRLLTAAWLRTRNEGVEIVPAIDGKGFDVLYQRTSKLSRRDCAELSEYIMAWGSGQDVQWSPTSIGLTQESARC